jgi:hypothetical protein
MDPKTYEINNLRILNDYLTQTIEVLARAQRIGLESRMGFSHSNFGQSPFGMPVQGMGVDPRGVDYNYNGLSHSPYGVYPYAWGNGNPQGWQGQEGGRLPTFVDPFLAQRGLSHTQGQWSGWSPYAAAEIARQRELQSIYARQQYEAMWRPFGT